jgi:hypothetical protein
MQGSRWNSPALSATSAAAHPGRPIEPLPRRQGSSSSARGTLEKRWRGGYTEGGYIGGVSMIGSDWKPACIHVGQGDRKRARNTIVPRLRDVSVARQIFLERVSLKPHVWTTRSLLVAIVYPPDRWWTPGISHLGDARSCFVPVLTKRVGPTFTLPAVALPALEGNPSPSVPLWPGAYRGPAPG